jgi:rSAM/selenodomain-associated transferase 2
MQTGRGLQMNLGASLSTGDVILFLHADSLLPAASLRSLLAPALPSPGWGRFDVRFDHRAWWARLISTMMNQRSRLTGIATGDQAIFLSRAAWDACGGYRELPLMEDVELCRRLTRKSRPYRVRAKVTTSARRWRRNGVVNTVLLMWRLRFLFWCGADPHRLAGMYRDAR